MVERIPKAEKQLEIEPILEKLDVSHIKELVEESNYMFVPGHKYPTQTTKDLLATFKDMPGFDIFGYRKGGQTVSYIWALPTKNPDVIAIGPMYVAGTEQGKGLGTKQVEAFLKYMAEEGFSNVYTKTWESNNSAQKIFETLGFELVNTVEADRINGDATLEYILEF